MGDFAPNFTARYRVQYRAAGVEHWIMFRFARGSVITDVAAAGHAHAYGLFFALASELADDHEFLQAEVSLEDTLTFTPISTLPTAVTGTVDVADFSPTHKITALHFAGRAPKSKGGLFVYGCFNDMFNTAGTGRDGVITSAESASIAAALTSLRAGAALVGTSNEVLSWHNRATVKPNDKLLSDVRRGIIA